MSPHLQQDTALFKPTIAQNDVAACERSLQRMNEDLRQMGANRPGPRHKEATGVALAVGLIILTGGVLLLELTPLRVPTDLLFGLAMAGAAAGYVRGICHTDTPRTWAEALDLRLAEHPPIDRKAFAAFQQAVREAGYLDSVTLRCWLEHEDRCCSMAKMRHRTPLSTPFLDRKL